MAKKIRKYFQRAHVLLILLICITLSLAVFILNYPQKSSSIASRRNFTNCNTGGDPAISINCSINTPANNNTLIATIASASSSSNNVSSISQSGATWTRAVQTTNASTNTFAKAYSVSSYNSGDQVYPYYDSSYTIENTSDGGFIVGGKYSGFSGSLNKYDSSGNLQWSKVTQYEDIRSIKRTSDGGYIIGGVFSLATLTISKYTSAGELSWSREIIESSAKSDGYIFDVSQTSDGGYVAVGSAAETYYVGTGRTGEFNAVIIRLTSTGATSWMRDVGGTGYESFDAVKETSDGGFIAAGTTSTYGDPQNAGGYAGLLVKYTSTGTTSWTRTILNGGFSDVVITSAGDYLLTGSNSIVKYNSTGTLVSQQNISNIGNIYYYTGKISLTSDGGFVIASSVYNNGYYDGLLIKFNSSSAIQWSMSYGGATTKDSFSDVVQASDGSYLVSGTTESSGQGGSNWLILKTTNTGNISGCGNICPSFPSLSLSTTSLYNTAPATTTISPTPTNNGGTDATSNISPLEIIMALNFNGLSVEIWYTTALSSASTSLTITFSNLYRSTVVVAEYSGLLTASKLDKTASSSGISTTASSGTTTTTAQNNQLWVGALAVANGNVSFNSPTNSFIEVTEANSGATTNNDVDMSYLERNVTATGTANVSQTLPSSWAWAGVIATFNANAPPTQIVFVTSSPTLQAGVCSNAITFETRDSGGAALNATGGVIVQISATTPGANATFYTTSNCSGSAVTTFTFNGSESSKTFYMKDTYARTNSNLFATKISGSDTLTDANLSYNVNPSSISRLGIRMPGQSTPYVSGKATGTPSTQVAGVSFIISQLIALDEFDNTVTSYSGAKTITYSGSGSSPNGTSPSFTTSVSFTSGVSTTTLTTTLYQAQTGVTLSATENGQYASPTNPFTVSAGALNNYGLSISNNSVTAGSCSANTLDITARDVYNNTRTSDTSTVLMTNNTVGLSLFPNDACTGSQASFTLSNGTIRAYFRPTKKGTGITMTATKSGDTPTGTTETFTVNPAPVYTLLVRLPGQSFTDGSGISGSSNFTGLRTPNATAGTSFDVVVYAVDTYNNLVDSGANNYTGSKTISWNNSTAGNAPSGTAPSLPATSVTFLNGASNTTLTAIYYNAASGRNIRADDTVNNINGTPSTNFIVEPSSLSNFGITTSSPQKAGVAFNVIITGIDVYRNNLGSSYSAPSGAYTFTTTAANAPDNTPPNIGTLAQSDFVNGTATKSVTLYKAQSGITFTVGEPSPSVITGVSAAIDVNPGDISADIGDSIVTADAKTPTSYPQEITIILKDTWRNPIPNVNRLNIIVSATGNPTIAQPGSNTDSSGRTTATMSWSSAGNYLVSVAINNLTLVQNDGVTADTDGYLDSTYNVNVFINVPSSRIRGGSIIQGGTTVQ